MTLSLSAPFSPWLAHLPRLLLLACLAGSALAADEGIDYQVLPQAQPTANPARIEVLEFFWYGCPHCFQLDPVLNAWLAKKPPQVDFRRMPAILGAQWEPHARVYYAAESLGVLDLIHDPLMEAIHVKKQKLLTEADLVDFVTGRGVDRKKFQEAYHSFAVDSNVKRAVQMGERMGINGVPSLIINGKFRASPVSAGGIDKLMLVLDDLIRKESPEVKEVK
ncbi:MAG: thiol:disulfide interchange protein DsbA/DsbL [Pseudomonadota bacterium]